MRFLNSLRDQTPYQASIPFTDRKAESDRILCKYVDRVPIVCERCPGSTLPEIDKKKYLVPCDLTVGQFIFIIRKRVELPAEQAIFLFVNGNIPPTAALMSIIYNENRAPDGFLYIQYASENTFGEAV